MVRINKLKIKTSKDDGTRIYVEYEREIADTDRWEQCSVETPDAPLPSFWAAMCEVVPPALALLELPERYTDGVEARGATFGPHGACVTLTKRLVCGGVFVLNTPFLKWDDLPQDLRVAVDRIETETMDYVDGKRAQMQLPLSGDGEK